MLTVAVKPPKCDHGVQGNHGVHADCSFGSTVLLSNPVKKVANASITKDYKEDDPDLQAKVTF